MRIFGLLSTGCEFSLSRELRQEMSWIVYEEITEYIAHHYATVTIRELVENFHFQEDYFNRLIRSKAGISYSEYVQRIRLEKAEVLLRTSSMTVDEVAEAVGYQNKGYFYKIFKKELRYDAEADACTCLNKTPICMKYKSGGVAFKMAYS